MTEEDRDYFPYQNQEVHEVIFKGVATHITCCLLECQESLEIELKREERQTILLTSQTPLHHIHNIVLIHVHLHISSILLLTESL